MLLTLESEILKLYCRMHRLVFSFIGRINGYSFYNLCWITSLVYCL
ncbi:hypothetical protein SAMN04487759_1497 [Kandleria vitulina]|uniref:Uncharacterized protein n=1 Tax=Kandleria vitulina TaxID=1630 RepID=A0A1H2W908_9FIRM|nr:hypothetical protein SAMN04487759_1497 [Kandleria vitulina]